MNKKVILISALVIVALLIWGVFVIVKRPPKQVSSPSPSASPSVDKSSTPSDLEKQITGGGDEELDIFMLASNLRFGPAYFEVKKDEPLKVQIVSDGTHTFTINELGVNKLLTVGKNSFTFTPTKSGIFQFYCKVPGHKEAGMVGELVVKE